MKKFKCFILLLSLIFLHFNALAQKGTVRGQVFDDATAEELIGVSVIIDDTTTGTATDLDGKFEISLDAGTYDIKFTYLSYATTTIKGVEVKSNEIFVIDNIRMKEDAEQLAEIVITPDVLRTTESALISLKRKSANVIDGVSAASFKKTGDSDAASAISRVTGVSVQGGKYVYVRGLGDRYTKTTLNGMDIPGLDPDRNTVQMDLFPTNIIDNITVSKSFTAEQPADFTGGVVNIELKDFPDTRMFTVDVGFGYNPAMHFNKSYINYAGGKTDFLGFDDGTRSMPSEWRTDIPQFANVIANPNGEKGREFQQILNGFNQQMSGYRTRSFMDYSVGVSFADQKPLKNFALGYNFSVTYKNETEYYEDAEFNLYAKADQPQETEMIPLERQQGDFGVNNVLLGAMAGLALKSERAKYRINVLHLQNGESKAGIFEFENSNLGANFEATQYNLEYSQRSLSNVMIDGTHTLDKKWKINWRVSPTISAITDPDIRFLRFREPNQTISTEVGMPARIWRSLVEYNISGKADISRDYSLFGHNARLKFGGSYSYKTRDFEIQSFQINPGATSFTGDPSELFATENLFSDENINGVRYEPLFIPSNPNAFTSSVHHTGIYVSNEFHIVDPLKVIVGLRVEKYSQFYTGSNQTGTLVLNNDKVIDDFGFFPSLNLIYALNSSQNLRFSFSQTTARPSFKEMSFAEILDPITGRTFIGGMLTETTNGGQEILWDGKLQSTDIFNVDLRWEFFQKRGQILSLSGFYKYFRSPIEIVQYLADPGSFQARNVGDARVFGAELEIRQSLGFLSSKLSNLMLNGNLTLTKSSITLSESELRSRTLSARDGEEVGKRRSMAGQAPYLINAGISYFNPGWKMETGVFYNVQGETLVFVGFGNRTDVYSVPFHSLNFKISKSFGKEENMKLSIKISNLLNDVKEQVFKSYEAETRTFTRLLPQRTFNIGFSYNL